MPHTLIFIDLPTPDPEASARFYEAVFGWEIKGRPAGTFHQIVPGGEFAGPDGQPSGVGNLHLGLFDSANPVPEPNTPPGHAGERPSGPQPRVYILIGEDETQEDVLARAKDNGASIDWELAWFGEFNGWASSFTDPWGVQILLWTNGSVRPGPEGA
jgi:predicted enzyme related to lactoylglutathione lyase